MFPDILNYTHLKFHAEIIKDDKTKKCRREFYQILKQNKKANFLVDVHKKNENEWNEITGYGLWLLEQMAEEQTNSEFLGFLLLYASFCVVL